MRALRRKRQQQHCADPVQVFRPAAHMSDMTTTAAAAPTATTDTACAEAGRQAIATCPEAFEELRGEGDQQLVEYAAKDDAKVIAALDAIGELTDEQLPYLGKFLAEQLVEDAIEAESVKQLGAYRAARQTRNSIDPLAYEETDPKHPGYLDRVLGAAA